MKEFADALAARLGVPSVSLVKQRETQPQKRFRSRENKRTNIQGAFAGPAHGGMHHVLLIDDVLDSGESLRAAGKALRPIRSFPLVLARAKHQDDR